MQLPSEWTKETYELWREELVRMKDNKYYEFHRKLVPTTNNLIGIRVPVLRQIAKDIAKVAPFEFLSIVSHTYYEEAMIHGFVIAQLKEKECGFETILSEIQAFLPYIDNWSVCDSFCASLKITKRHEEEMLSFITQCLGSNLEFTVRFAFVMLLDYYRKEEYLEFIFRACEECKRTEYYIQMAIAWLLSMCIISYEQETLSYLERATIDDFTFNKSLQKAMESLRCSKELKDLLQRSKRK